MGLSLTLLPSPYHQPERTKFCHPQAMNWVLTLEDTDHQGHSRRAQVLPRKHLIQDTLDTASTVRTKKLINQGR